MHIIEKIEISGFRSISKVSITCRDMNVFAGLNDAGKSNILKALNLFFNGQTDFLTSFNFANDYSKFKRSDKKKKNISIKLRVRVNLPIFEDKLITWEKKFDNESITEERLVNNKNVKNTSQAAPLARALNQFHYYYIPALKSKEVMTYILSKMGEVETGLISKKNLEELNKEIADNTASSIEELAKKSNFNIKTKLTLPNSLPELWETLQVNSDLEGTSEKISLMQRGDGIKSIYLPILLEWIQQQQSKTVSGAKSNAYRAYIWGIDEPENSLEYRKAEEVAQNYWSNYCVSRQVFITTHSSSFILPPNQHKEKCFIFSCTQDNEKKTIIKDIDNNLLAESESDDLLNKLGLTLPIEQVKKLRQENEALNIIKSKISYPTLIVEGKSDAIIIEAAWKKTQDGKTMPFNIIMNDQGGGVNYVNNTIRSLQQLNAPEQYKIIGLLDRDKSGVETYNKLKNNINKNITSILLPCPNFRNREAYCGDAAQHNHLEIEHYFTDDALTNILNIGGKIEKQVIKILNYTCSDLENKINSLSKEYFQHFYTLFNEIENKFNQMN